jgi:diacylglycerol kinase (ATP)
MLGRMASPAKRALVVANPIAGRGRGRAAAERLREGLAAQGFDAGLHLTRGSGDATRAVAEAAGSLALALAVGGDGTLGDVLNGLDKRPEGRSVRLAALPMGTANVLALDLGLPRDPESLLEAIAAGHERRLDVARVGERLSFLVVGVGFDAMVVEELDRRRRGPISKSSWLAPGLSVLARYREPRLTVELDGRAEPGRFGMVLVSNAVHYAGLPTLSAERRLDDGRFEVYLFPRATRLALLGHGLRALTRRLPSGSCRMALASRVRVDAEEPVPYQVDGDAGGRTPVEIAVEPPAFRLCVPAPHPETNSR